MNLSSVSKTMAETLKKLFDASIGLCVICALLGLMFGVLPLVNRTSGDPLIAGAGSCLIAISVVLFAVAAWIYVEVHAMRTEMLKYGTDEGWDGDRTELFWILKSVDLPWRAAKVESEMKRFKIKEGEANVSVNDQVVKLLAVIYR